MTTTEPLPFPGLKGMPTTDVKQTGKDFTSNQEVRWCPGCGDYAVLKAVQSFLPDLGLLRDRYLVDVRKLTTVRGMPFGAEQLEHEFLTHLEEI